jgi:hypothetical protein
MANTDSTAQDQSVKVGNPMIFNMPTPASKSGAAVYAATDIIGGIIVHNTAGGTVTGTLPSPDSLASLIENPRVGDCVECLIINGGSTGSITLTAVAGVTFDTNQLGGSQVIATLTSKYVIMRFTNITAGSRAYVVYS